MPETGDHAPELLIGSIELGGTKTVVAVARDPARILRRATIATRDPRATLGEAAAFFAKARAELGPLAALGIGAFGPITVRREADRWGIVGSTTKPGWRGADIAGPLAAAAHCPVALDTDVNAAALAESELGAGRGLDTIAYLTVGTGIGGGIIVGRRPVHGAMHPEIGHLPIRRDAADDYRGCCPYHDDCAEGLASGAAIVGRFGVRLDELDDGHPFYAMLADYLGQLCAALVLTVSPQRIVIGGGVMAGSTLHGAVESAMAKSLGGYIEPGCQPSIVPPKLGGDAGLIGGLILARRALASG